LVAVSFLPALLRENTAAIATWLHPSLGRARDSERIMATYITDECINCGACEPECPNEAISEGEDIYVIDPKLCTECVGFHDHEACQAVCPVECCLPDPKNVETEEILLARAKALHPDKTFVENFPSRFRKA
jgi:ferredoxin